MAHPAPHNFSRSPVEEVVCQCIPRYGSETFSRIILSPYPGWLCIREEIRNMIKDIGDVSSITGCMLRYTDRIPGDYMENLSKPIDIACLLSGRVIHKTRGETGDELITRTSIPNTSGLVSSSPGDPNKPGWILIFTMETAGQIPFPSHEAILNWFEDARAEIHVLFDLIVPEQIVQSFR